MLIVNCATCGKEIEIDSYRLKRSKNFYCCKDCQNKGQINKKLIECTICGKLHYRTNYSISKIKDNIFCCSKKCMGIKRTIIKKNIIRKINEDYSIIEIKNKKNVSFEVIIDTEDINKINELVWSISRYNYAFSQIKRKSIRMHRFILNIDDKNIVHHKNGNKLDNRKDNLEIMTNSEHMKLHRNEVK